MTYYRVREQYDNFPKNPKVRDGNILIGGELYTEKEFNKLPDVVKKTIGDYGQLISWALADTSQLSYIQQKFFKDFSKTREIEKNNFVNQLTTTNKKLIGGSYE